ncbi:hypothetical protein J2W71_004111 [Pseudomonas sp. 3400]|nr:hypothetical protein [Pseudomonas sp. 3400]MDR7014751.1 hypothetical protein [Pseudomonas alcaliphila]
MSQPMHLRAPATHAAARMVPRPAPSSLLDDWSSLSTLAMPVLAPARQGMRKVSWLRLISTLIAKRLPACRS